MVLFIKVLLLLHSHELSKILKDICKIWMEVRDSKQDQMFTGKDKNCTSTTQCPRLTPGPLEDEEQPAGTVQLVLGWRCTRASAQP